MSTDLDEHCQHSHQTGHGGIREKDGILEEDGIETPQVAEAVEEAKPTEGKSRKGRVATRFCLSFLATAVAVLSWRIKELAAENGELKSMGGELLVKVAELVAENEYLKSASGAGTTLNGHRKR